MSFLAVVTKFADLTEITKITDIAIFRSALAEITEIMQMKSHELFNSGGNEKCRSNGN